MVKTNPHLDPLLPGSQRKYLSDKTISALDPLERDFIDAIHSRHIMAVFQPITDGRYGLQGIEILTRWQKDGTIFQPADFLSYLKSEYAWLLLTAFVVQEAVHKINECCGDFYFSVNIPSCIANHKNFCNMMQIAKERLSNQECVSRLVLEFSETVNLFQQKKTLDNMKRIQELGFKIYLDDCFSKVSVLFPVRSATFNGYKIDMSIVDDCKRDPHAQALVRSLVYYCKLIKQECIAEGIDSHEKFALLKKLGVQSFQGYLISPPVVEGKLNFLIKSLTSNR